MTALVNGTLLINVHIAPVDPSTTKSIQVLPENPSRNIVQEKMFMDEEFADVVSARAFINSQSSLENYFK